MQRDVLLEPKACADPAEDSGMSGHIQRNGGTCWVEVRFSQTKSLLEKTNQTNDLKRYPLDDFHSVWVGLVS